MRNGIDIARPLLTLVALALISFRTMEGVALAIVVGLFALTVIEWAFEFGRQYERRQSR